jgi:hypothetical protein
VELAGTAPVARQLGLSTATSRSRRQPQVAVAWTDIRRIAPEGRELVISPSASCPITSVLDIDVERRRCLDAASPRARAR